MGLGQTIGPAFADFAPGLAPFDWLVGIVGAVAVSYTHLDVYKRQIMRRCINVGLPIAGERITACFGQVIFTSLIARLGTVAVAAHAIAITAEQAFYIPGLSLIHI